MRNINTYGEETLLLLMIGAMQGEGKVNNAQWSRDSLNMVLGANEMYYTLNHSTQLVADITKCQDLTHLKRPRKLYGHVFDHMTKPFTTLKSGSNRYRKYTST